MFSKVDMEKICMNGYIIGNNINIISLFIILEYLIVTSKHSYYCYSFSLNRNIFLLDPNPSSVGIWHRLVAKISILI